MKDVERKQHWESIYQTKTLTEVSWYEPKPETSLSFLKEFSIPKTAKIIDVGGGDSFWVDNLLALGYENITVLDISAAALNRVKERLGTKAEKVQWIVADAANFTSTEQYDFWHDRAAFHFLTKPEEINNYVHTVWQNVSHKGYVMIGTFSENGPKKCSEIDIKQYSKEALHKQFQVYFEKIKCINTNHQTPFNTLQNFTFCSFKKLTIN